LNSGLVETKFGTDLTARKIKCNAGWVIVSANSVFATRAQNNAAFFAFYF